MTCDAPEACDATLHSNQGQFGAPCLEMPASSALKTQAGSRRLRDRAENLPTRAIWHGSLDQTPSERCCFAASSEVDTFVMVKQHQRLLS